MDKHWYGLIYKLPNRWYRIMYYENRQLVAVVENYSKLQCKKMLANSHPLSSCADYRKGNPR